MILYPKVVTETGVTGVFAGFWRVTDLSAVSPIVRDALSTLAMSRGEGGVAADGYLYRWMNSNADEPIGNNIFPMVQRADAYERPGLRIESLWGGSYGQTRS